MPNNLYATAGITRKIQRLLISRTSAASIQKAVQAIKVSPVRSLTSNRKVTKIGENIYSFRANRDNRILFGLRDDKKVILDLINVNHLNSEAMKIPRPSKKGN